jgi:hypothetical protein
VTVTERPPGAARTSGVTAHPPLQAYLAPPVSPMRAGRRRPVTTRPNHGLPGLDQRRQVRSTDVRLVGVVRITCSVVTLRVFTGAGRLYPAGSGDVGTLCSRSATPMTQRSELATPDSGRRRAAGRRRDCPNQRETRQATRRRRRTAGSAGEGFRGREGSAGGGACLCGRRGGGIGGRHRRAASAGDGIPQAAGPARGPAGGEGGGLRGRWVAGPAGGSRRVGTWRGLGELAGDRHGGARPRGTGSAKNGLSVLIRR